MMGYAFLAILNGVIIGTSRALNGQLSIELGPFKASFWNHAIGFAFLTIILFAMGGPVFEGASGGSWAVSGAPGFTYLGGLFGALFVAVNSYVLPRIGAIKTVLLVISGQMITGVLIDAKGGAGLSTLAQLAGVALILLGVYLAKRSSAPPSK
ncbi:DMT family transporter [Pendulispora albinea]|uniref:DMT family transporter n=1 Tax=Pendulispora albinea TaxID=2741071 RepID=A0ABZ2M6R4_9BACT